MRAEKRIRNYRRKTLNEEHKPFSYVWKKHSSTTCPQSAPITKCLLFVHFYFSRHLPGSSCHLVLQKSHSVGHKVEACQRHVSLSDKAWNLLKQGRKKMRKFRKKVKGKTGVILLLVQCCLYGAMIFQLWSRLRPQDTEVLFQLQ